MTSSGFVTNNGTAVPVVARVRPRRGLLLNGLLVLFLVPLPVFGTLIVLGVPNGSWPIAVAGEAFCILLCAVGYLLFKSTWVAVSADAILERSLVGRQRSVPRARVHSMVLAFVYSGSSNETLPQLIVRDSEGSRLLRLRGIFWTEASIRTIAASIGGPLETVPNPLTAGQFFDRYAGSAYWFENRPLVAGTALAVALLVCAGLVLGLMRILGLPIS